MLDWQSYDELLLETIEYYMPEIKVMDDESALKIVNDIIESKRKYNFSLFSEYFKYGFLDMNEEKRQTFFGGDDYGRCAKNSIKDLNGNHSVFRDKMVTYELYKDYYKREIIEVKGFEDFAKFAEFASKHSVIIVKENEGSLGANISQIKISSPAQIKPVFFKVLQYGGCVCEPWIEQSEEFARLNDSSVNTIRIATVYDERGLTKMYGMLRTGRNGNVVDNASNGGIAAEIDLDTGVVVSDGYTKTHLEHFERHPDTGVRYKGFQIPRWNEVLPMVEEMHKICPVSKLVGWDLALTNDGWALIEGNGKPNIDTIQMIHYNTFGRGLRDVIENAMGKYRP